MKKHRATGLTLAVVVCALGFAAQPAPGQKNSQQETLLQRAIQKETVDGDLAGAIKLYKEIAANPGANRAAAARALVRMGQCYEKLGSAEARKAYAQVVREFSDQAELAAEARTRLAALAGGATAAGGSTLAVRRIWAGAGADGSGSVSPDGTYLSVAAGDYNLGIHELATGTTRILAKASADEYHYGGSVISPDGKQVAYRWHSGSVIQLRVIGLNGAAPRVLLTSDGRSARADVRPDAWSPDGKNVLVVFGGAGQPGDIALVSVADGAVRVLKTFESATLLQKTSLSPDGRHVAYDWPQKPGSVERDIFLLPTDGGREVPLAQHPASDLVLGWTPDGKSLLFASDRTRTWDAWLQPVEGGRPEGAPVLLKAGIGDIAPIGFARHGSFYYRVRTDLRDVFIATLDLTTGTVLSAPTPVAPRIGGNEAPDWSPDGKSLAYLSRPTSRQGPRAIVIRSVETGEQRELVPKMNRITANFRWSPDGQSVLARGYDAQDRIGVYVINLQTGDVTATIPGAYYADWSPDGRTVLCATNASNGRPIVARDLHTDQDKQLFSGWAGLSLAVSPDGRWIAFSSFELDPITPQTKWLAATLWIMPITGGEPRQVLRLQNPEDFTEVAWAPDGRQLLFVRRNSKEKTFELWRIRTEGGEPQRIPIGLTLGSFCQISLHPDGRRIALNAGSTGTEIWVMENFLPAAKKAKM